MSAITQILSLIAKDEGGIKDVGDGKGTTYFGQTKDWLDKYGLPVPQSAEQAMSNWSVWLAKTKLDQIVLTEYDEAAHFIIDFAVNSGSFRAICILQSAMRIHADGVIGPKTLEALSKFDRKKLAREVMAARMEFQGRIITDNPEKNAQFAAGWANRNARLVRRIS